MQQKKIFQQLAICIAVLLSVSAEAQNALRQKIADAHTRGAFFETVHLFNPAWGDKHETVVKEASLLKEDMSATVALYQKRAAAISLTVIADNGKTYTLEMLQSHPLESQPEIGYIDAAGRHRCNYEEGLHYQGIVKGSEVSVAAMSVFANGDIMLLFSNEEGNFNIGKLEDGSGNYIFYKEQDMLQKPSGMCETLDPAIKTTVNDMERTTAVRTCRKVRVYWECDYDLYNLKGGLAATQAYLIGLFNEMQVLYANENVAIELSSFYIWTTQDTYNSSIGSNEIFVFMGYWNARGDSFNGDIAMLLTHDGGGGIAGLNGMNYRQYAYGFAGLTGTYSGVPTYSWDVTTPAHEMGHQCGLNHTHNCVWHTGTGGSCGAIDNCYTLESSTGCTTCGYTYDIATTGWQGTIMSYCHLVSSVGVNLSNGFGPLPAAALRNNIAACANLSSVISIRLTPTPICNNDGAVTLSFNANNQGTAPYTYYWSGGKTTQNINGLSLPGNYSVSITDSNHCSSTVLVNVPKYANPGDGKGPNFQPICCKDTSFTYTLSASAPANLTGCQTVAWLRTTTAIANYSAAQAAYNSAATSDIIYSTNSNSINSTTPARLDVLSPTPCSVASYYYTPFITKKARAVITLTDSNTTIGTITTSSVQIGNYTTLPDNKSMITICDANDTPTVESLVVTVSGYTGRTNHMTLSVQNSSGNELYYMNGLTGNGSYTLPIKADDNLLQYLKVSVYDFYYRSSDTIVASSAVVKAARNISYPAITKPSFESVCQVGSSAHLSFAPNTCVRLDAANITTEGENMTVYPNPGTDMVTLEFRTHANGNGVLTLTDVLGRTITTRPLIYTVGLNKLPVDIHTYANGVYFLVMKTEEGSSSKIKLAVQR